MITAPKCKVCGNAHWGTCYTPPERTAKKSTAARKDVPRPPETRPSAGEKLAGRSVSDKRIETPPLDAAGNQAPPVDTPTKRGRKPTGFDKKAYDREKAKARRAAKKETPK